MHASEPFELKGNFFPRGFLLVAILLLIYSGIFIFSTSFVVWDTRYFSLFDDEMISMRYARNLVEGNGLVWNPGGERVEGFTNPLWTLAMAGFHLLPIPPPKISICVQLLGLLCVLGTIFFTGKAALVIGRGSNLVAIPAMCLVASYYPFINWSLQGTEVSALALLITAAIWLAAKNMTHGTWSVRPYALMGIALWVRPDAAVPLLVMTAFLAYADKAWRIRHVLTGIAVLAAMMGIQTGARFLYYGDILPNTYYLKLTGFPLFEQMARGVSVLNSILPWPLLALLGIAAIWSFFILEWIALLPLAIFLGQLAYSVYVGGDAWEWWGGMNRYVCIAAPALFIWVCLIAERWGLAPLASIWKWAGRWPISLATAGTILLVAVFNASLKPKPIFQISLLVPPPSIVSNMGQVLIANFIEKLTAPDARIAVIWAGAVPYFTRRAAIDILGKSDRYVSRLPANDLEYYPGHMKWDYGHSIDKLAPDVVTQVWKDKARAIRHLRRDYEYIHMGSMWPFGEIWLYFRTGSKRVKWELMINRKRKALY